MDWKEHGVKIVHAGELDMNTPQTSGMTRAAAITHARTGAAPGIQGCRSIRAVERVPLTRHSLATRCPGRRAVQSGPYRLIAGRDPIRNLGALLSKAVLNPDNGLDGQCCIVGLLSSGEFA